MSKETWSLSALPPAGHDDVGEFIWKLYEDSVRDKDKSRVHDRWLDQHRMFRGDNWNGMQSRNGVNRISIGLLFSNIERTVANITARNPVAEVKDMDGVDDGVDMALSQLLKGWYSETEQQRVLEASALNMEMYGITVEKYVWDVDNMRPDVVVVDPFSFFPAPGYYECVDDMPYVAHVYPMSLEAVADTFDVPIEKVKADVPNEASGEERRRDFPAPSGTRIGSANYPGNYASTFHPWPDENRDGRALVVEMWVKDYSLDEVNRPLYPGGIRKITVCNGGELVLDDRANPNIDPAVPEEQAKNSFLYYSFPFSKANSYEDTADIWGFSAYEQTRPILVSMNELLSRMVAYLHRSMGPTLILPRDSGVPISRLNNRPGLVIQPANSMVANAIRYLDMPELPRSVFNTFDLLMRLFDRVWSIEDADRGESPNGVIAASAIAMLQEKNAVLIRQKIRAIDYLVRQRGRAAISLFQHFGANEEVVDLSDHPVMLVGKALAGRRFGYVVEAGSTFVQTSMKIKEDALELYRMGAIDRRSLLETLEFPGWRDVVERMGETELDAALNVLVQSGMPEDYAMQLRQVLMQPQGGPGDSQQKPPAQGPQPGTPTAYQGGGADAHI